MPVNISNLGYVAVSKETTKGTVASVPSIFIPVYSESLMTQVNLNEDNPIIGNKAARWQLLRGLRHHTGEIQAIAEPNTAGYLFDMLLTRTATSGSDPYTHTFGLSSSNPNSYTVDISKNNMVFRFMGVEASELGIEFDDNRMLMNLTISGLKSFLVREIASVATATVTFNDDYDPAPTDGLYAGDLVRIVDVSDGSTQDFTVSSVDSDTEVTLSGSPSSIGADDLLYIRPQSSPSFSTLANFLWARTEFRFADDASTALSATHTPQDEANWNVIHSFVNDEGEKRSGSFDPAELARGLGDATLNTTKFFDSVEDLNRYLEAEKRAVVVRHFSGDNHELRLTLNNIKTNAHPANLESGDPIMTEFEYMPEYDDSDGQIFDVKVINGVSSI